MTTRSGKQKDSSESGQRPPPTVSELLDAARLENAARRTTEGESSNNDAAQNNPAHAAALRRHYLLQEQEKISIFAEHLGFGLGQAELITNPFTANMVKNVMSTDDTLKKMEKLKKEHAEEIRSMEDGFTVNRKQEHAKLKAILAQKRARDLKADDVEKKTFTAFTSRRRGI